jgi:dsDNA-binding SOS-regulon protein
MFREMENEDGETDRKALTEKEKADRWDDLLEKSDRAGGTILLGNSKLASDSLRFSDYSTLTTLAL